MAQTAADSVQFQVVIDMVLMADLMLWKNLLIIGAQNVMKSLHGTGDWMALKQASSKVLPIKEAENTLDASRISNVLFYLKRQQICIS